MDPDNLLCSEINQDVPQFEFEEDTLASLCNQACMQIRQINQANRANPDINVVMSIKRLSK